MSEALRPRANSIFNQCMGMNKSGLALTIGVLYFSFALPLAKKKHFASSVRGNLQYLVDVLFFHDQDQVGFVNDVGGQLPCDKPVGALPTVFENLPRRCFHGFTDPGGEACGGHRDR